MTLYSELSAIEAICANQPDRMEMLILRALIWRLADVPPLLSSGQKWTLTPL